ncbi:MAG: type II toxin-antitoxin system HicA family toxin [Acidobacteria bacterium]|nr:type II toxin-antitoxin system HicA family toxin [Acidobacteriota bacterium]
MAKITPISWKTLKCVFEKDGFTHVRTEGDHMVFTKSGVLRPVVIPKYQNIPVFE